MKYATELDSPVKLQAAGYLKNTPDGVWKNIDKFFKKKPIFLPTLY